MGEFKNVTSSILETSLLIISLGFLRGPPGPPLAPWIIRMFSTAFSRFNGPITGSVLTLTAAALLFVMFSTE